MKTVTFKIQEELEERLNSILRDERVLTGLKLAPSTGRKDAGKGELIRRALNTGLTIEVRKLLKN